MKYQNYIKAIIYATVALWIAVLWLNSGAIQWIWLKPLSTVTSAVLILVMVFDLWAWKIPLLHGWFVKRPVIDGTWAVEITSDWIDPETAKPIAPIKAYMAVRQTLSSLSMRLLTAESSSSLVGTEIVCSDDGIYCVSGVYRNEPWFQFRQRSEIHYGGLWLQIAEDNHAKAIRGHYWTDRKTAGSIVLSDRSTKIFQSFHAAHKHFQPS